MTAKASALEGVEMIVTQGEGSGLLNPNQIGNRSYAHFYKFEEIVCGRRLEKVNDTHYAFIGARIPFDKYGVWPMRNDPRAETVPPDSNCYIVSRTFHKVYRSVAWCDDELVGWLVDIFSFKEPLSYKYIHE